MDNEDGYIRGSDYQFREAANPAKVIKLEEPMIIKVVLAVQYGQRVTKPYCEKAALFAKLAGTTTLTPTTIEVIKRLGYRVEVVPTEPKEL